jgi:D-amino-acid dehydrogenase
MSPWMMRFALAAFRLEANTRHLAPLVSNAADVLESQLLEVGRGDLIRRNGHYALWLGPNATARAAAERARASSIGVPTADAPIELLRAAADAGGASAGGEIWAAGVWYPASAHVLDPAHVARAFATASAQAGGSIVRAEVQHVRPHGNGVEIITDTGTFTPRTTIICAGAWSPPLLAPFGINAPIEAERGYHVELPNHAPLIDAPILYADHSVFVTPMASRLRASTFLEFAGLGAPADPGKPRRLRAKVRQMGYDCAPEGPSWMGPRPTLPDYLPGIGRAPGPHELYYAVGHQHLGLTLSAVTADLIAALVMGRTPRFDVTAFDLRRFGSP